MRGGRHPQVHARRAIEPEHIGGDLDQVAAAPDYAHEQGIIHRDVKPSNVLMERGRRALLTDFGLARMVEASVQLTKSRVGVGTPAYMPPEQGQRMAVNARSDVHSLGGGAARDADGGGQTRLTNSPAPDAFPSWGP